MANEQFGNLGATTVGIGGYTAGSGVLNVISTTGSPTFSTSAPFRVTVEDVITFQVYVVLKVTAINSGTQFAVVAEGSDANAAAGCNVFQVLTAGSLLQLIADSEASGTFANLPVTVSPSGYKYKCTDAPYTFVSNGSLWVASYDGCPATLPGPSGNWTADNLSANNAYSNFTNGYGYLIGQSSSNSNFCSMLYQAAPGSTPYSFMIRFVQDGTGILQSINAGGSGGFAVGAGASFGFRDSGGKYVTINFAIEGSDCVIYILKWNSSTSLNADTAFLNSWQMFGLYNTGRGLWAKIKNDGTNLIFSIGIDANNLFVIHSETITSFLSNAASVTWGTFGKTQSCAVALYDWTQGT